MSYAFDAKEQCPRLEQYITKLDRTLLMDMYFTIPLASLQRPLLEDHNLYKEGPEVAECILKKPGDQEHISFEALIGGDNEYCSYSVYPFYALMVRCAWVNSEIVRLSLKSRILAPLENHINVVPWERKVSGKGLYNNYHPRNISKQMNILTNLLISPSHNHLTFILN